MPTFKTNTYRRERKETVFDLPEKAILLRQKMLIYCMDENHIPKRWRYVIGKPAVDKAAAIRDNIIFANDIHAITEDLLKTRAAYQQHAISCCNLLQMDLRDMTEILDGVTHENLREVVDLLSEIVARLISWKKSDKVCSSG